MFIHVSTGAAYSARALRQSWRDVVADKAMRNHDAAAFLGVSECELVASLVGEGATRLTSQWVHILTRVESLGRVMALKRNDAAVHERRGVYQNVSAAGHMGLALGNDFDLRLFFAQWAHGYAAEEPVVNGALKQSLPFFDASGEAVQTVLLQHDSELHQFALLVEQFRADAQSPGQVVIPREPYCADVDDADSDIDAFRTAWINVKHTHEFFEVLKKHGITCSRATRFPSGDFAKRIGAATARQMLEVVAASGTSIMCFVGNPGCVHVHTAPGRGRRAAIENKRCRFGNPLYWLRGRHLWFDWVRRTCRTAHCAHGHSTSRVADWYGHRVNRRTVFPGAIGKFAAAMDGYINEPVLIAETISVQRNGRMLLDKVSITLCVGQMVAAMGENGTGTSTLLNVCAGDISSDIGCITLAGRALRHWRPIKRAKMRAVLPQETKLFFIFSAQEVVLMSRSAHCHSYPGPHDLAIAGEASQHFDVAHLADKRYPMLSGGARVRMMLARALAQAWEHWVGQSRALMLDEPIAALDLAHRHQALAAAKNYAREEGIAVLAVLHDVNVAAKYADHVTPLKHGTLFAAACTVDTNTVKNVESCFGIRMIGMKHPVHTHQLLVPA